MLVAPIDIKDPKVVLRFFTALVDAVKGLLNPQGPVKLYACAQADLPAAADTYANRAVIVTDLQTIAICTLNGTAWEWTRADGGAL